MWIRVSDSARHLPVSDPSCEASGSWRVLRSRESPAHLGRQCVVRYFRYGFGPVKSKVRRNSQVSTANRGAPAPSSAYVSKATVVTRRKPPPHLPPTAYRPLTPQSPVAPNPTFPCRRGRRRSQESPAHLGLQCVVRCVHYGLGLVQPTHRSPKLTGLFSTLGKSRPPWTTVGCSMSSIWAWTDATQGSPKLTGLYCIRESPATEHVLSLLL